LLGILALVVGALGPVAAPAQAAPTRQGTIAEPATGIIVSIDEPTHRSGTTARNVLVRGWAADPTSERGTGVSRVDLYLDAGPDQGGRYLGRANYGRERPDVASALGGSRFLPSGWDLTVDMPRGPHTIVAVAAPTGAAPALVVPGVASTHATVGGPAGRTAPGCGSGGYCTSDEGGELTGNMRPAWRMDPLYSGNLYVGSGAFGHGDTAPPYGWWDALLDDMVPYLIAYRTYGYPYSQWFHGHVPRLYDQGLLTTLSTQGALALPGAGCVGPAFGGADILGLSVIGGYYFGFPYFSGIGITGNGTGTIGGPNVTSGGAFPTGVPLSIPFSGALTLGSLSARGYSSGYNAGVTSLARFLGGGRAGGPGGIGGAIGPAQGFVANPGALTLHQTGCNQRL
jgi:hypothetical protein